MDAVSKHAYSGGSPWRFVRSGFTRHHVRCETAPVSPSSRSRAIALALVCLTVACTGATSSSVGPADDQQPQSDEAGLPSELHVADVVQLTCSGTPNEAPDDFLQPLGVVALPAASTHPTALQTSARTAEDGTEFYFAKTGLWWRGNTSFQLIVPTELRPVLAIGWGGAAELAHTVNVDCDPDADDDWLVLAGGYWVREPMCAELIVEAAGVSERIEIGLGRPCPGQDPPAGPSGG